MISRFKTKIYAFLQDRRGSFSIYAGMVLSLGVMAGHMAANMTYNYKLRQDMQAALDSTLLSIGREDDIDRLNKAGREKLREIMKARNIPIEEFRARFFRDGDTGEIVGRVRFDMQELLPLPLDRDKVKVEARVIPRTQQHLEIALALDVSGSMRETLGTGTRMSALRGAVDAMMTEFQVDEATSRGVFVSVVPFAGGVNISPMFNDVAESRSVADNGAPWRIGEATNATTDLENVLTLQPMTEDQKLERYYGISDGDAYDDNPCSSFWNCEEYRYTSYYIRTAWAGRRTSVTGASLDAPPTMNRIPYTWAEDLRIGGVFDMYQYYHRSFMSPTAPPMALTNDKTAVRNYVNSLVAMGGTAGHVGMEWAWFTIAPGWRNIWGLSPDELWEYDADNSMKAMVMMTDGVFGSGTAALAIEHDGGTYDADPYDQFLETCKAAREKNVRVYTIAFSEDAGGLEKLKDCASDESFFFEAKDAAALTAAFVEIANSARQLRLTQ